MIKVRVLKAENLPLLTKKARKTRIYCTSSSSYNYYYESFKNKDNTINPQWNAEFDVDLFRCSTLTFLLYSSRLLTQEIFIGRTDIDIINFFQQEIGKQILNSPQSSVYCEFPITIRNYPNATLSLSFSYFPTVYRSIGFSEISNRLIHVWATFTPSIPYDLNNENFSVEIELIELFLSHDKKNGYYYNYNKLSSWEAVGRSSNEKLIHGQTGNTQIHTILFNRVHSKYHFFIANSINFKGVVTLNFVAESGVSLKEVKDQLYLEPKKNHIKNVTIKTVDISVEKNKKYTAPVYLHYEKKIIKKDTCNFETFPCLTYNKENSPIDGQFTPSSEFKFYSQIIDKAHLINPKFDNVYLQPTNVMNISERMPLSRVLKDLNLTVSFNLRIYIGGSTSYRNEGVADKDYWEPQFIIFDKKTLKRNTKGEKALTKKPHLVSPFFGNSKLAFGMRWNSYVNLNLDQFDINHVIVFIVHCESCLESADEPGFCLISQVYGENETLLIRNMIYSDKNNSHFATLFRIEFIEDEWEIIPMRFYFKTKKNMYPIIDSLFANNWILPEILTNQNNTKCFKSSDEENLIETTEN